MIWFKKLPIYLLVLYLCSCANTAILEKPDYIQADLKTKFFKVVTNDRQANFVAVEYWAEYKDFVYLYADLLLQGSHLVVIQFVKFNADFTVNKTRHFLVVDGKTVINGGVHVGNDVVSLNDIFYGRKREIHMPFTGKVLHPIRLVEYLKSQNTKSLTKGKYTFIDWRSAYWQLDQFTIKKIKSNQYKMPMQTGIRLDLETTEDQLKQLKILFNGKSVNPDSVLMPSSQTELETKSGFDFDYSKTLNFLNWAEDF